jgi:hypothetical protein
VKSLPVSVTARSSSVCASRPAAAQSGRVAPGSGAAGPGCARRGDNYAGRCCAPTSLRCSPRGRAAKLAALASRAALGQSPRVRGTKRASRADPEAALLGAADIASPGVARPRGPQCRSAPARCRRPLGQRRWCRDARRGSSPREPRRCLQRRGDRRSPECVPPASGAAVRSREAQHCRPAREARFVHHSRRDCSSGARAASVASFAAGPAVRASQGTPAKRGQAPARRKRAVRIPAIACRRVFAGTNLPRAARWLEQLT